MITFKEFITEEAEFDLEQFKKDCAFVLNELKGSKGERVMLHGTKNEFKGDFTIRPFKERAGPRDSSRNLHDGVNRVFKDMFGVEARNWMFVTGDTGQAKVYSPRWEGVLAIFPIGKMQWLSAVDKDGFDLTTYHSKMHTSVYLATPSPKRYDEKYIAAETDKLVLGGIKRMNWRFNKDLVECLKNGNEIMMECDKFYAFKIHSDTFTNVVKPFLETL